MSQDFVKEQDFTGNKIEGEKYLLKRRCKHKHQTQRHREREREREREHQNRDLRRRCCCPEVHLFLSFCSFASSSRPFLIGYIYVSVAKKRD
jgi:hypothetical protein